MNDVLAGIRVVEVASWTFVPSSGAILAEWGAEVIKIEDPERGDPQRGLISSGLIPKGGANFMYEIPNRGKRSVGLNIACESGRELLYRLVETADVFVTNYLPDVRQRLGIELAQIRARNPKIVYVRGSGNGQEGAEASRGARRLARCDRVRTRRRRSRRAPSRWRCQSRPGWPRRPPARCPSRAHRRYRSCASGSEPARCPAAGVHRANNW